MNKVLKRAICGLLTIVMILSLFPSMGKVREVEATGTANDIISVALSQEGYTEGSNNDNKYGACFGRNNESWCGFFVSWCARQAGVPENVIKNNGWAGDMGGSKRTGNFGGPYYPVGQITPQAGDLVYYDGGEVNGESGHVEIVISYNSSSNTIDSIGGNTNGSKMVYRHNNMSLSRKGYALTVIGFERPNYVGTADHVGPVLDFGSVFDVTINDVNGESLCYMDDGTIKMQKYSAENKGRFLFRMERQSDGSYYISSWKNGYVIDIQGAGTANSTPAQMYPYNGSAAQHYFICDIGGGYYVLEPKCAIGSVLDRGGLTGEILHLWKYEQGNNNQKFVFGLGNALNLSDSFDATIEWDKNGKCLYENTDGNVIAKTYSDEEFNRFMWHFTRYSDGSYKIYSWNDKKCLDVSGGANSNATNILTYADNGSKAQKWDLFDLGNGTVVLEPRCAPARTLDVGGDEVSAHIWEYEVGNENQVFKINKYDGDGICIAKGSLNGHEYEVHKDSISATQAREKELNGYHLATITSEEEYEFIMSLTKKISKQPEGYWLGADDNDCEGIFKWNTREEFYYNKWPDGQPDNKDGETGGPENYFGIWASGIWNDFPERYKLGYVLEKEPENDRIIREKAGIWNDHEYKVCNYVVNANEARELQKDGWYLATITSKEEKDYIWSLVSGLSEVVNRGYWLGGNDTAKEGTFVWETGESFSYAPWETGEPSNKTGDGKYTENHLSINKNGLFNDAYQGSYLGYILERKHEIPIASIEINDDLTSSSNIYEGDTIQLTATVLPENATDKSIIWTSSNDQYATVNSTGFVKVKKGIANEGPVNVEITATNSDNTVSQKYTFKVFSNYGYTNANKTALYNVDIEAGILRIFGSGPVEGKERYPWTGNKDISSVVIDNGITSLDSYIFEGVDILSVELPKSVNKLSKDTFTNTSNSVKNIIISTNAPEISDGTILSIGDNVKIHVPEDAIGYDEWNLGNQIIYDQPKIGNVIEHKHEWKETITKAATCDTEGNKLFECEICEESYNEKIPALGHDYSEYISDNNATCTKDGTKTATCSRCKDKLIITDVGTKLGHAVVDDSAVDATCNSSGLTAGSHCSRCKEIIVRQNETPKLSHIYDDGVVTVEPTLSSFGKKIFTCKLCGDQKELVLPKLEENEENDKIHVESVSLDSNLSMNKGEIHNIEVLVYPLDAENKELKWSSGNVNVAMVNSDGTVAATGKGRTTITASSVDGNKTDTCVVTVWDKYDTPAAPTLKSATIDSIEVNKISGCEYSKDLVNWQSSNIFTDLDENTEYTIYVRKMENATEYYKASTASEGTIMKTAMRSKDDNNTDNQNDNPSGNPSGKTTNESTDKHVDTDKTESPTPSPIPVYNPGGDSEDKSEDIPGIGVISEDGSILTDEDGDNYYISTKLTTKMLKKNALIADKKSGGKFRITKLTKKKGKVTGGNVTYMAPYNKNCTKAAVPDKVKLGGVSFKVTEIQKNAFKNCKKITSISIGINVIKIGANSFNGCSKLSKITIRTTKLRSIGANAFKGIKSNSTFRVPKKQLNKYSKMIKNAKAPKKAKITKIK